VPELDHGAAQLLAILRQAHGAVQEELRVRQAQDLDREALLRLLDAVRSFADQAQSLFIMMTDSGADEAATMEVKDLATSFWAAEDRIEAVLGLDRM
jgi:hypothetical protein